MKNRLLSLLILCTLLSGGSALAFAGDDAASPFCLPTPAGTLRLGMGDTDTSYWLDACAVKKKSSSRETRYTVTNKKTNPKGSIELSVIPLTHTEGFILKASALTSDTDLYWAFGACAAQDANANNASQSFYQSAALQPDACKYNVFSVEGCAFTTYFGESMKLKVVQAVTPLGGEIRLSDAHRQESPRRFWESGKKTDAPALGGKVKLTVGEPLYFCFYRQNREADYNYYLLPALYNEESTK